jgi:hypothetical protein
MIKRIKIFRFPAVMILGFALCVTTTAQQPQSQQATQNAPSSAAQPIGASAADVPGKVGTGKQESSIEALAVKNSDQAGNREQEKDKDSDATAAKHKTHFHLGTVTMAAGYTHYPRGFFNSFYPFGFYPYASFYAPFYYDPFYNSFYYPGYIAGLHESAGRGHIKLSTPEKDKTADVYIDNAYAGTVGKLKSIWLDPGAYDLSVKGANGRSFQQRIYVLSSKTLKIKLELNRKSEQPREEPK